MDVQLRMSQQDHTITLRKFYFNLQVISTLIFYSVFYQFQIGKIYMSFLQCNVCQNISGCLFYNLLVKNSYAQTRCVLSNFLRSGFDSMQQYCFQEKKFRTKLTSSQRNNMKLIVPIVFIHIKLIKLQQNKSTFLLPKKRNVLQ